MGGQQLFQEPQKLSEKLFRDHGDVYGRRTADDKISELRDGCMGLCKYTENNIEEISKRLPKQDEEIILLKKENDFLKQQITNGSSGKWGAYATKEEMQGTFDMYRQMQVLLKQEFDKLCAKVGLVLDGCTVAKPSATVEQPKIPEPVKDDLEGWVTMSELIEHLKVMRSQGKTNIDQSFLIMGKINKLFIKLHIVKKVGNGSALQVSGTKLGKMEGYVKDINTGNSHTPRYNIEKCVSLLGRCSTPESLLKTMDLFDNKFCLNKAGEALA